MRACVRASERESVSACVRVCVVFVEPKMNKSFHVKMSHSVQWSPSLPDDHCGNSYVVVLTSCVSLQSCSFIDNLHTTG